MLLHTYYKRITLYPFIVAMPIAIVFSIIDNYNYKSEWLTADAVIFISIIAALVYCLIISLLSLTIFLNKLTVVKEHNILNFLSWFLLPWGFIATIIFHEIKFNLKHNEHFDSEFWFIVLFNLPFIVAQVESYFRYRKVYYSK